MMKRKWMAMLLALMLCASCASAQPAGSLLGTWSGGQLTSDYQYQMYMVYLAADGTGSYIDSLDPEILASGVAPVINWQVDGTQLLLTYQTDPARQIRFDIVINNGFLNLRSANGITLICQDAPAAQASDASAPAEPIRVKAGEETVLLDERGLKVYLTGEFLDYDSMINLTVVVENNSNTKSAVYYSAIVNGWEMDGNYLTGSAVSAGAKAKQSFAIHKNQVSITSLAELETLGLTLKIRDEHGNQLFEKAVGTLCFTTPGDEEPSPFSAEELAGDWVEIHHQDSMTLSADGKGENSYIQYHSANSYSTHDRETFSWSLRGSRVIVGNARSFTFRESVSAFDITEENGEPVLRQGELVYKRVQPVILLKMGQQAVTDLMTFAPVSFEYTDHVSSVVQPITRSKSGGNILFSPGDGLVWGLLRYQVSSPTQQVITGKQWSMSLGFGNGIAYESAVSQTKHYMEGNSSSVRKNPPDFSAFNAIEGRTAFALEEKMKQTMPVKLVVKLPSSEYGYRIFEFHMQ